jgi:hypothetical protein
MPCGRRVVLNSLPALLHAGCALHWEMLLYQLSGHLGQRDPTLAPAPAFTSLGQSSSLPLDFLGRRSRSLLLPPAPLGKEEWPSPFSEEGPRK